MTQYALFKDGKQATKSHSTIEAAFVEAVEQGFASRVRGKTSLNEGCLIKPVPPIPSHTDSHPQPDNQEGGGR